MDSSSKTPSSDKSESPSKSESSSIDENLFEDFPTFKVTLLNIQAKSEEIEVQGLIALSIEPTKWETPPATLFTKRKNDPPGNVDDEHMVLSLVLDLSGIMGAKGDLDSDDNKPLSRKLHKKGSSSSIKASIGTIKIPRTRSSTRNLMREALEISNKNTKKRR